jgi:hypothetical protein
VVRPGQSIQAAVDRAHPGDTVLVKRGIYHQSVQIRKDGITLRGSGGFYGGTVIVPPKSIPKTLCNQVFGPTGICILAKKVDVKTGAVIKPVRNDKVTALLVKGFAGAACSVTGPWACAYQGRGNKQRRVRHLLFRVPRHPVRP